MEREMPHWTLNRAQDRDQDAQTKGEMQRPTIEMPRSGILGLQRAFEEPGSPQWWTVVYGLTCSLCLLQQAFLLAQGQQSGKHCGVGGEQHGGCAAAGALLGHVEQLGGKVQEGTTHGVAAGTCSRDTWRGRRV